MQTVNGHWVDTLDPYLIRFGDGGMGIRWYGVAYAVGFLFASWLLVRYWRKGRSRMDADAVSSLFVYLILGVMIGGRLGETVFYEWKHFVERPMSVFEVWKGGMSAHGGFIGVAVAVVLFARRRKLPLLHVGDCVVSAAPFGILLGRLANFVNGELWGKVSDVSWAVVFPLSRPGYPLDMIPPRHPSQLYEAAMEGVLLFAWMQWRVWKTEALVRYRGRLVAEFLIGYGILRCVGEVFREPDGSLVFGALSRGTVLSIVTAAIGVALYAWILRAGRGGVGGGRPEQA